MFLPEDIDEATIPCKRVREDGVCVYIYVCICTTLGVTSRLSVRRRQRWTGVFGTTMQEGGFVQVLPLESENRHGNCPLSSIGSTAQPLHGRSDDLNSLVPWVAKLVACEQSYFS